MRFGIFQIRTVSGANVAGFILGTAMFAMFLMLTLYMQQVLGYSADEDRRRLPRGRGDGDPLVGRRSAARDAGRRQAGARGRDDRADGRARATSRRSRSAGSYLGDLLPGFLLVGFGIGFSFVPISIAALAGVQPAEAGLASGLINTSQQIGGALGIAALSTIASTRTDDALASGTALPTALVDGFTAAFVAGAIVAALGILAALTLIRREELAAAPEAEPVEAQPAFDVAA